MSKQGNVTKMQQREYFVYDREVQRKLSTYNKLLIETAFMQDLDCDYEPETDCIISTGHSLCRQPRAMWDVDTCDYDALVSLVGHLEAVKANAIERIRELDRDDRGDDE